MSPGSAAHPRTGPSDALTPQQAVFVRAAQRMYQRGERIEVPAIAERTGVHRSTVYRQVGGREQLIVQVLWSLTSGTFRRQEAIHQDPSVPRAGAIIIGAATDILTNEGHQAFVAREGELALRLLTTTASGYQQHFVGLVREVVQRDAEAGHLQSRVPLEDLPFVLVRTIESYSYFTLITGDRGEVERGTRVIGEILAPQFHP